MRRKAWSAALALGLLVFIAVLIWLFQEAIRPQQKLSTRIAVVVYGDNATRWRSLDQGVAQACTELNIERPIVSFAPVGDAGRQASLLRREIEGGVDGLLIAAVDDVAITAFLEGFEARPPVVMVEASAGPFPHVGADDANMARMLADECLARYENVAIVYEGRARESVRIRQDAFIARMRAMGSEPQIFTPPAESADFNSFLSSTLAAHEGDIDCLVALDTASLEAAMDALPASMVDVSLCGIGAGSRVANGLDVGTIEMLVFPNEYATGYLGMYELARRIGILEEAATPEVEYRLVTRENMYLPEVERLLFPINQ